VQDAVSGNRDGRVTMPDRGTVAGAVPRDAGHAPELSVPDALAAAIPVARPGRA
jgi:hypothetical protein